VLGAMRGASNFVDPGQAIIVLPDFHLRLRSGMALDLFLYAQNARLVSLGDELRGLLSYAHDERNTDSVQVGDMYETWETEVLARLRFRDLLIAVQGSAAFLQRHGASLRSDWQYMIRSRRVLREMLFVDTSWEQWAHQHTTVLSNEEVDRRSVQFTSTEDIESDIRDRHSRLFNGSRTLTRHDLRGNHDNNITNYFWREVAGDMYRNFPELRGLTATSRSDTRPQDCRLGVNECIWFEHGHKYDWHNCNLTWWHPGRGFDLVEAMTRHGHNHAWTVRAARAMADLFTDVGDTEMRHFTLLRVDEILRDERAVNLVVMGHSHQACLLRGSRGSSFFWMHPHAEQYLASGSCLPAASSLARRLPRARFPETSPSFSRI
jgi:hypothetical protein